MWTRDFSLYFGARAVSLLGDAMMPVAAALAVGARYGVAGVGYVLAVWTATCVLLIVFGGVFADRIGARAMMVGADVARAVTQGVLAVAFLTGSPPLWLLLAGSALSGAATAMFQPGVNGMVPLVARDPQRANGVLKVADAMCQLAGPAVAGVLTVAFGAGTVYAVDAGTFVVSGLCLALIRPAPAPAGTRTSMTRDLRRGWVEFTSRTWMWSVIVIWIFFGLFVFGPYIPLASRLVGEQFGWVMAALGAGTVAGGVIAMRLRPARPLAAGAVALIGFVAIPLPLALGSPLPVLLAGHVIGGTAWAFWSVMWSTSVQTLVPPEVLNRVTAYEVAGSVSGLAVGQAVVGPLAEVVSARHLLMVSSVVCLGVVAALLLVRPIRRQTSAAIRSATREAPEPSRIV
ncbi:MFS transporter [Actinoplanes sp. HUAS TT8]|uniref:MFS transporter n=1 Tax=Actinoplanes sp. HUAS TT8 TaxID=3447453 RepID=UPI003F51FB53